MENKNSLLSKVFGWLFIGLLITFVSGYLVSINENMMRDIFGSNLFLIFVVAEVIIALVLRIFLDKLNKVAAILLYIVYTILTGLTISTIFVAYKLPSIVIIFLVTSILFGIFALIGRFTKIDLSKFGIFLLIGIIAIIVLAIINAFVGSEKLDILTCIIGVVIFIGYIAYDVNRITKSEEMEGIEESNYPIIFAFDLYIDFINLFIDLMRLFGDSND